MEAATGLNGKTGGDGGMRRGREGNIEGWGKAGDGDVLTNDLFVAASKPGYLCCSNDDGDDDKEEEEGEG